MINKIHEGTENLKIIFILDDINDLTIDEENNGHRINYNII